MSTPNGRFGFGHPASPEEIAGWDIDIMPDGTGLPAGSGTVAEGKGEERGQGESGRPAKRAKGGAQVLAQLVEERHASFLPLAL